MDINMIASVILLGGVPLLLATLMFFYPVATLMFGGLLSVYLGAVLMIVGVRVASRSPEILTGLPGLGLESGGILMGLGATMVVLGGVLRAILKALRPEST